MLHIEKCSNTWFSCAAFPEGPAEAAGEDGDHDDGDEGPQSDAEQQRKAETRGEGR